MAPTADDIRAKARRFHADDRDEIPIAWLVGHIPEPSALEALRELRQAGEIEMTGPGYWRLSELEPD